MLRLKTPGGHLTSSQLKLISKIAAEEGRDFADLTARQEIQLPGISSDRLPDVLRLLEEAALSAQDSTIDVPPTESGRDPLGVLEQEQADLFTIGIPVLAGRLKTAQMRKAADVAERYGDASLRQTTRQNLLIPNIPKERVVQVMEGLDAVGLRVSASVFHRGLVCCSDEKTKAVDLVDYLEKQVPLEEPLSIHLSDSACACVHSPVAQIGLEGVETYEVKVGGFTARGLPAGEIKYRLEKLLVRYKQKRQPQESFSDFCRRIGDEELARLLSDDPLKPS